MDRIILRNITLDGKQTDICLAGGRIRRILPHGEPLPETGPETEIVDCTGKAALPGFVNMHTHAAMTLLRGVGEDMLLDGWLSHIWSIESRMTPEFVYHGTKVAALEMIKTGTTTFNDQYWFPEYARKAACEMGLHSLISYVFLDKMNPEEAARQKDQCLKMFGNVSSWDSRSIFTVSIHSVYTVSEELILWATEFARKHNLKIHIHLSESAQEVENCRKDHGGLSPVEYLDRLGILGPDVIAAHSLWLSDKDVEILGRNKVSCVHNINSNAKLASGYRFRWKELEEAGANVCLGTDGCASSNNLDMLEVMKTTAIFQKAWREDPSALPLSTLLAMATENGAKAAGLDTGKIEEGKEADIQIIDTDSSFFLSPAPFLANFIYSAHSDCISSLIAGGRFVMRDRKVEGEKQILSDARGILKTIDTT